MINLNDLIAQNKEDNSNKLVDLGLAKELINDKVLTDVPANAVFTDTVYTHPTTAGNKHIPTGGAAGQYLKYSESGTAAWATPAKADVGLGNVDNTSDDNKPISTAQQTALNAKLDADKIIVVTELPTSPDSDTFYFIEE